MSYKIIGKYIKDLNFNIPDPETFFSLPKNISNYKINIDIKSTQIKNKIIEIQTTLGLYPTKKKLKEINTKIIYSTIVELTDEITDKQEVEKIILIKVPTSIYPDLRKIFVFLFENSGFKEVNIARSVDFQKLYQLRKIQ
ncbi:protein-export chaperone SecB [Pelagibacteraceae bacterium]|nr:protein-export chaperone SecB [Pelagibacteraceae bacterium]|tara:strand:+ start:221 stop:640 length:420 start_codon:yes stop_codon:yes gene_type:complete